MLNPFPELLTYGLLSPFILRLVLSFIFVNLGILALKNEKKAWVSSFTSLRIPKPELFVKIFGVIEIVGGAMLILGFYTQIASIVLAILTFAEAYIEYRDPSILKRNLVFYVLIFSITISLIFSGAGAFAIDLPL